MAESPLATLARVAAGVVLMQGNLGHQVLGQLLIMGTNEVAIAAASVVLAGTTNQRSAVGQMIVRTVVPAVAVRALLNKQERRLEHQENRIAERERALNKRRSRLKWKNRQLHEEVARLKAQLQSQVPSPPSSP